MITRKLSIIVVNFNAEKFLKKCLASIYAETKNISFDVWVVDNNSSDMSVPMVHRDFLQVNLIENKENLGFAKACNQAIIKCTGDYILLLNPDTLILESAIEKTVKFMDADPTIGICGCRVLNEDMTLQLACRRSIPTPGVAFFRLAGLSKLFPKSKIMAEYNLTYLDEDKNQRVDAVSGAFLMMRRNVIDSIGLLDERFFMYGEELDYCIRTKGAGWNIMYYSNAKIIHYKGECSKYNSRKAFLEFYRSMYLFHKKHFAINYNPIINIIIYIGIALKALTALGDFIFFAKVGSKR
ncbi:MAG: glycosyltransferase family 2 protein [Planctomycetes bacterium HGW-Planctomycetes-1]|nr:MAG: glycosyltransferase family 2 protein [Planctomycetes bacterium HGW-Planctomycetes-1]